MGRHMLQLPWKERWKAAKHVSSTRTPYSFPKRPEPWLSCKIPKSAAPFSSLLLRLGTGDAGQGVAVCVRIAGSALHAPERKESRKEAALHRHHRPFCLPISKNSLNHGALTCRSEAWLGEANHEGSQLRNLEFHVALLTGILRLYWRFRTRVS